MKVRVYLCNYTYLEPVLLTCDLCRSILWQLARDNQARRRGIERKRSVRTLNNGKVVAGRKLKSEITLAMFVFDSQLTR